MFRLNNKDSRTTSLTSFWCFYCHIWTDLTYCSGLLIIEFEQVNAGWEYSVSIICYAFIKFMKNTLALKKCFQQKLFGRHKNKKSNAWKRRAFISFHCKTYLHLKGTMNTIFKIFPLQIVLHSRFGFVFRPSWK